MQSNLPRRDEAGPPVERLDFELPDFARVSWVSDPARAAWEPRLARVAIAWTEVECATVAAGLRPCCVVTLPPEELARRAGGWARSGLYAVPLEAGGRPGASFLGGAGEAGPGSSVVLRLVVGAPRGLSEFMEAGEAGDHRGVGRLLGHPPCCHEFFKRAWVDHGLEDTTWPMALATAAPRAEGAAQVIEVGGAPQANILWRWMGVRAVPHLPCRFDCEATVSLADAFQEVGRRAGYGRELDWLLEVLSWPVEWSALHGIAQVKTPVLKLSTKTDATARKYVVRRVGDRYPEEGARGLKFPYRMTRQPVLTLSRSFRQGLENPLPVIDPPSPLRGSGATILEETLRCLEERAQVAAKAIRSVHLGSYFTVVELEDGSVGACMSYYDSRLVGAIQKQLGTIPAEDPLLLGLLFGRGAGRRWGISSDQERLLLESLRATVLSALSAEVLRARGDASFTVLDSPPRDLFGGARRALVLGFGGYMEALAHAEHVTELHIHDLSYGAGRPEMDEVVSGYRRRHPHKTFTLSDGRDTERRLAEVDLVSITGSALCNGTMDGLLRQARNVPRLIVQGQSAALHPKALFDRGVHLVVTTLKPPKLAELARLDPRGDAMRPLLEGGLPSIYLVPRKAGPRDASKLADHHDEGG